MSARDEIAGHEAMASPAEVQPKRSADATVSDALRESGAAGWLVDAVAGMVRGEAASLDGLLAQVGTSVTLAGTRACCRCHFVVADANGRPRVDALSRKLARQVQDYCIPRSRITEAEQHYARTGSTEAFSALEREARELFVKLEK